MSRPPAGTGPGAPHRWRGAGLVVQLLVLFPWVLVACESRTVVPVEVVSVEVEPAEVTLLEGEDRALEAVPRAADGGRLDGRTVSWTETEPSVVEVDGSGTVTALQAGVSEVEATVEGVRGSAEVTVLPGPSVAVDPDEVQRTARAGEVAPSAVVAVRNGGNGTLTGLSATVRYGEGAGGWLSTSLDGTAAPANLTLTPSAAGLGPGRYEAVAEVRSPVAPEPGRIDVTFVVTEPPPRIELSPNPVELTGVFRGEEEARQDVAITNGGGGSLEGLSVEITGGDAFPSLWLDLELIGTTAPATLVVEADPLALPPGTYEATVEVRSQGAENSPVILQVRFEVLP